MCVWEHKVATSPGDVVALPHAAESTLLWCYRFSLLVISTELPIGNLKRNTCLLSRLARNGAKVLSYLMTRLLEASLEWVPITFVIVYGVSVILAVLIAVLKKQVKVKTPILCNAGAWLPSYYIFSVGLTVAGVLKLFMVWIQYGRVRSLDWDPNGNEKTPWLSALNVLAGISGTASSLFQAGMGFVSFHQFPTLHNIIAIVYMVCEVCYQTFVTAALSTTDDSPTMGWRIATTAFSTVSLALIAYPAMKEKERKVAREAAKLELVRRRVSSSRKVPSTMSKGLVRNKRFPTIVSTAIAAGDGVGDGTPGAVISATAPASSAPLSASSLGPSSTDGDVGDGTHNATEEKHSKHVVDSKPLSEIEMHSSNLTNSSCIISSSPTTITHGASRIMDASQAGPLPSSSSTHPASTTISSAVSTEGIDTSSVMLACGAQQHISSETAQGFEDDSVGGIGGGGGNMLLDPRTDLVTAHLVRSGHPAGQLSVRAWHLELWGVLQYCAVAGSLAFFAAYVDDFKHVKIVFPLPPTT